MPTDSSSISSDAVSRFTAQKFRPPAVPLIAVDPYFSIWSLTDKLTEDGAKHWTGLDHGLCGLLQVDGKVYGFMGTPPNGCSAMQQVALSVFPTRTVYTFQSAEIELKLTFTTPAIPEDLELFSWPLAYVQFAVSSRDGKSHAVVIYIDLSADIAVDDDQQEVIWVRLQQSNCEVVSCGSLHQRILEKVGDNVRIDWGYLHLALPKNLGGQTVITCKERARLAFVQGESLPQDDETSFPCPVVHNYPRLSATIPLQVADTGTQNGYVVVAYDDLYSLEYQERKLRPYWRRNGGTVGELLRSAIERHDEVTQRCEEFDRGVVTDLDSAGGPEYARLASLAFRQTTAAHKLVADYDGTLLYFSKENFSNGCIGTVDVTYPSSPFFLYFNPALLQAQIEPLLIYAQSPRWKFPFAPHDLGTYPKANGQVYGGGEKTEDCQMPVEECGNLIILAAALAVAQGSTEFAEKYWKVLTTWADYLAERGFDPEQQLCTDDFAGHLAHNANLSIKAIIGIGCYARLCQKTGRRPEARRYRRLAEKMVGHWLKAADDGDHYRLCFDGPKTWSMKYNLLWDRALGLNLFPDEVVQKESAYYLRQQQRFGMPLDNRQPYGKADWTAWWAALTDKTEEFREFVLPLYKWCDKTDSRVPITDWYYTTNGRQARFHASRRTYQIGFQARSVVGGFFAKLYMDEQMRALEKKPRKSGL